MARHQVIALAGKRLEIKPSPTSPGHVLVQVLSADRQVQASLTLDPSTAAVAALALNHEAEAAEVAMGQMLQGVAA
ncbi:MAG: hypothetical protein KF740_19365 [Ramlibacter sp.]|nr:hypothetical protein [Ramlibacter sp.]